MSTDDGDDRPVAIADEIARIAGHLGRAIVVTGASGPTQSWRVVQVCPICRIELGTTFREDAPTISGRALHRTIFALYDMHRCVDDRTPADTLREMRTRTESESVRMAERAAALESIERDTPTSINLFARAEREFVVLAEWVARIDQLIGSS